MLGEPSRPPRLLDRLELNRVGYHLLSRAAVCPENVRITGSFLLLVLFPVFLRVLVIHSEHQFFRATFAVFLEVCEQAFVG